MLNIGGSILEAETYLVIFYQNLFFFAEVYLLHLPCTDVGASSCVALVRFGVKMCWGLPGVRLGGSHLPFSLPFFKLHSSGELFRLLYW